MHAQRPPARRLPVLFAALLLAGCAGLGLGDLIRPPEFEEAEGRQSEMRLFGPSRDRPIGGAGVRLWARVSNPNAFGLTLTQLAGTLSLEGTRAATVDLPLGMPMPAAADTVIPIDISLSFADLPALADLAGRAISGQALGYRLDGTLAVDAGPLGEPSFGPMRLLAGEVRVVR